MGKNSILRLPLGESIATFDLEKVVCNHGFFMMAPNTWFPSTKTLQRPLRLADSHTSVLVSVSHPPAYTYIIVKIHDIGNVFPADQTAILAQVSRMLRISESDERRVREFQELHPEAKKKGFGRLFRSPTIFEDAIKTILLCNCGWKRTLEMARGLCKVQSEIANGVNLISSKKRKRSSCSDLLGNFPSSKEIANLTKDFLIENCSIGYRAGVIVRIAKDVERGKLTLNKFEEAFERASSYKEVYEQLKKIQGFGPFTSSNLMMCIGFYQLIPVDTETIRLLKQVHGRKKETVQEDIKVIYDKYAPFQCLAYWYELLEDYEKKFGKLSELPYSKYDCVTGGSS